MAYEKVALHINVGRKTFIVVSFVFMLIFVNPEIARATSGYVLPYPSAMPGSKLYILHKVEEKLLKYWYFGDYGRFTYNRQLSDKYLVEAKTLFEYKQYVFALDALLLSDSYFIAMKRSLLRTQKMKNGRAEKITLMRDAALKHEETLRLVKKSLPEIFIWQGENEEAKNLTIHAALDRSISIRKDLQ
ncbi:MAG: hypothetical protein RLZZ455_404 [Candidatus Parcubacteria bacterium]|jgi:hypothetical protein